MLTLYDVTNDRLVDRKNGEYADSFRWNHVPSLNERLTLGTVREWEVIHIEEYRAEEDQVYLAIVSPAGEAVLDKTEWNTAAFKRDYPEQTVSRVFSTPDRLVLCETDLLGRPPEDEIPNDWVFSSRPEDAIGNWVVKEVKTYRPTGDTFYQGIHVGWCVLKSSIVQTA